MPRGDSSPAQVASCALELFARHGVAGTSLQMIADELGVTKAAVYYHYRTRDQIVQAVLAPAYDGFEQLLDHARRMPPRERARAVVNGLAQQAVAHRELYAVVLRDVTAAQFLRETPQHLEVFRRLHDTLSGTAPSNGSRVAATIFLSGLMGPPSDPDIATLDDDALEAAIAEAGRRLLDLGD